MKTALIVVDVQNHFVNGGIRDLPKKISEYIENDGGKYDFVLFTQFVNMRGSNFTKLLGWDKCVSSPDIDIHSDLRKFVTKDNVFQKTAFSALKSELLAEFLKKNGVGKLVFCGTDTEACVYCSAVDAFDIGFEDVKVLIDLCGSSHGKEAHESVVKLLKDNLWGCVMNSSPRTASS